LISYRLALKNKITKYEAVINDCSHSGLICIVRENNDSKWMYCPKCNYVYSVHHDLIGAFGFDLGYIKMMLR
jgi:hypothetical protein